MACLFEDPDASFTNPFGSWQDTIGNSELPWEHEPCWITFVYGHVCFCYRLRLCIPGNPWGASLCVLPTSKWGTHACAFNWFLPDYAEPWSHAYLAFRMCSGCGIYCNFVCICASVFVFGIQTSFMMCLPELLRWSRTCWVLPTHIFHSQAETRKSAWDLPAGTCRILQKDTYSIRAITYVDSCGSCFVIIVCFL